MWIEVGINVCEVVGNRSLSQYYKDYYIDER
jgi:hypothetical protein